MPDIEDTGRDGYPFAHIDTISDPGAWRDVLPFCINVRILPDMALKCPLDAVEGRDNPDPATDVSAPFHSPTSSDKGQPDNV